MFFKWEITVNKIDVPTYLYGVLVIITTLKEIDNDDDDCRGIVVRGVSRVRYCVT